MLMRRVAVLQGPISSTANLKIEENVHFLVEESTNVAHGARCIVRRYRSDLRHGFKTRLSGLRYRFLHHRQCYFVQQAKGYCLYQK